VLAGSLAALSFALVPIWASGSWTAPVNLSSSTTYTEDAAAAVDSVGRVHVVWSEGGQILHRYSAGGGWTGAVTVAAGWCPALVADAAGQLHIVFVNRFADIDEVYYKSWKAETGWQLPVNVSEGVGPASSPNLVIDGDGGLAVVWSSASGDADLIYVATSADGALWSSWPVPNAWGTRPVVAVIADGQLAVAWQGPYDVTGSPLEVFFSEQSNALWTLPQDVSMSPESDSMIPSLAVGGGQLHLAWQEETNSGQAVYHSVRIGSDWSSPQKRSAADEAFAPVLAAKAGAVHMVWTTGGRVQYVARSDESGTWGSVEDVAVGQSGARDVSLAVGSGPHVVWLAEASPDNDDAFHSAREAGPSPTSTVTASATPSATATTTPTWTYTPTATRTTTATATATSTLTLQPSPTTTPTLTSEPVVSIYLPCIRAPVGLLP
jgi:hypothetical protein